jgi:hypothetical protein
MREGTMSDQSPRFFLRIPAGYFMMTEDEQKAAAVVMWREVMTQLGENPDKLIGDRATQDENPDDCS